MPLSVINTDPAPGRPGIRDTSGQDRPVDQAPGRRRRRFLVAAVVAVVVVATAVLLPAWKQWSGSDRSVSRERVRTAVVQRGEFVREVSVQGSIVAAVSPTLYAPAAGAVDLIAKAGDEVEEGDVLARIDSPELTSRLRQEEATLQSIETDLGRVRIEARQKALASRQGADLARVRITAAERELRRAERSWEMQVISLQDLEKARDEVESAKLAYEHALQDAALVEDTVAFDVKTRELERDRQALFVEELERQVDRLTIRSPVTGMIGNLAVDQKAAVVQNQPLFTVVDLTAFEVELNVPELYADDLAAGQPVVVNYGTERVEAELSAISPEVAEKQVRARARFAAAPPAGLRQNQRVSATIVLERKADALFVQRGPFLDVGGGRLVYVVDGDLAVRRPIETGSASISAVEILSGLSPGETIIISGTEEFRSAETVLLTD